MYLDSRHHSALENAARVASILSMVPERPYPNLRHLIYTDYPGRELLAFIAPYCVNSLQTIHLNLGTITPSSDVDLLLQQIWKRSPNVSNLLVNSTGTSGDCTGKLSSGTTFLLAQLRNLEEFRVTRRMLVPNLIRRILWCKKLKRLEILSEFDASSACNTIDQLQSCKNPLPMLEELVLSAQNEQLDVLMHASTCFNKLKTLKLRALKVNSDQKMHQFCRTIVRHTPALRALKIEEVHDVQNLSERSRRRRLTTLTLEAFSPLHSLTGLTTLVLELNSPYPISDHELVSLLGVLSNLSTFELVCARKEVESWYDPTQLTLAILSTLSLRPNQLRTLRVQLHTERFFSTDAAELEPLSTGPHLGRLEELGFHNKKFDGHLESQFRVEGPHEFEFEPVRVFLERCLSCPYSSRAVMNTFLSYRRMKVALMDARSRTRRA